MRIDWNEDSKENGRYYITDAVMGHYISEEQISDGEGEIAGMEVVARMFSKGYDHSGNPDEYAVCDITDLADDESHAFAFDGRGNFEWDTDRQG